MPPNTGNWIEWKQYVLGLLEDHSGRFDKIDGKLDEISKQVWMLKVKAGIWGIIGGAIPIAITLAIIYLRG